MIIIIFNVTQKKMTIVKANKNRTWVIQLEMLDFIFFQNFGYPTIHMYAKVDTHAHIHTHRGGATAIGKICLSIFVSKHLT